MKARKMTDGVYLIGAVDWDRRLFDAFVPLPDGTSYNAYLIEGGEKVALVDTVDPTMKDVLFSQLDGVDKIDFIIAHHAEQDHSGIAPFVLEKYPQARVVTSTRGKGMLAALLPIAEEKITVVEDGEILQLGQKTLKFIHLPWVHWPETMGSYLIEDKILFSCDFFGSHFATTDMYSSANEARVYQAAKRYYAEIMMPFHTMIQKNLEKIKDLEISMIAPSHGPVHDRPEMILAAYRDWAGGKPKNLVALPYISMHGSTRLMVDHLVGALVERGVAVEQLDLTTADMGKLAMLLLDAATLIVGTPTMLGGAHPSAFMAAYLANLLKPRTKFVSVVGSYGWGGKAVEQLTELVASLKAEVLAPVLCKGLPQKTDFEALDNLAEAIAAKHKELDLL
jgi:flavorubredoxin